MQMPPKNDLEIAIENTSSTAGKKRKPLIRLPAPASIARGRIAGAGITNTHTHTHCATHRQTKGKKSARQTLSPVRGSLITAREYD